MPIPPSRATKIYPPPAKKRNGCLLWLAIAAGLLVLAAVIVGLVLWRQYRKLQSVISDKPQAVAIAQPAPEAAQNAQDKVERLTKAVRSGISDSFAFTGDELNALVATAPQLAPVRGKTAFTIDGDRISAEVALPLDAIPGLQGRFLNAQVDLDVKFTNGALDVHLRSIRPKSGELPQALVSTLTGMNLGDEIRKNPEAAKALGFFSTIEVRDGQLTLVTRGRN